MGWELPRFAHIPLIHGADGAKLSKRHGARFALEFREQGYLPEALCNYLLRLGWSHGDLEIVGPRRGDPRCSTSPTSAAPRAAWTTPS